MIHPNEPRQLETGVGTPMTLTFPQPAPQNSYFRVSAFGEGYQISTDNGTNWAPLRRQPSAEDAVNVHEPYFHPVPAGTTKVMIKTTVSGWWGLGGYDYASIWSTDVNPSSVAPSPSPATLLNQVILMAIIK